MTGSVRIKICGVTTPEDALAAVEAGADLIGINFVEGSPRQVDVAQALAICEALAGHDVERVALFRNERWDVIDPILQRVPFERVQFHGEETEEELEVDRPPRRSRRFAAPTMEAAEAYPSARSCCSTIRTQGGGQGQAWDWSDAEQLIATGQDIIIAGADSTPENVGGSARGRG